MPSVAAISMVSVTAHAACALLLAVTFAHLSRLFPRPYLRSWSIAWACLLVALLTVRLYIAGHSRGFWVVYLAAEWYFLAALLIGCYELAQDDRARRVPRFLVPGLPAAAIVAGATVPFFDNFNALFSAQAAVLSLGYAAAFLLLGRAAAAQRTVGFHLMRVALGWLCVQFLLYVPLFFVQAQYGLQEGWARWLGYSSLADLCGQLLLGFGMVFVVAEATHRELAEAVASLRAARDQLAAKAHFDPLTGALNRHAMEALLESAPELPAGGPGAQATLAMIDLDHLKAINDTAGHHAGDAAIRAAADAIRQLLQEADQLFRWGGDEFLVLLPGCDKAGAVARLAPLGAGARFSALPQGRERRLHLTWGVAELQGPPTQAAIDDAIARADQAMYGVRAASRAGATANR
jgi:diguanylate cyclase (GGDEF)-like protein